MILNVALGIGFLVCAWQAARQMRDRPNYQLAVGTAILLTAGTLFIANGLNLLPH